MKATLKTFCEKYTAYAKLAKKVIAQAGVSAADAPSYLRDVRNAADGYSGFIYYNETTEFYRKNKSLILDLLKMYADDFGQSVVQVVQGFNCMNGSGIGEDKIALTLYGKPSQYDTDVANSLAWFALEEVANRFNDFAYECEHNN